MRLRDLAASRVRYGYRRLTVLLKREGWKVNAKRIYRLYTEEGLIVRTKRRKERAQRQRVAQGSAVRPNQKWSMDFVAQRLADGRWIRVLTVVDQFTRECLALFADVSLTGEKVATALDKIVAGRGASQSITVDNGTSLRAKPLTCGPTATQSTWISSDQGGRSRTALSKASMANYATNV
jgi:putative transposase